MAAKSETADILLFLTAPAGVTAKEMFAVKTRDGAFLCELARAVSAEVGEKAKGEKKWIKKRFTR